MTARTLMVQGTTSSAGKSLVVTALCRLLRRNGLSVAPFKAQNMALNAAVTPDGGEIGRAQAVQAEAAGVPPHVDMNPILLKPEGDTRSQVVVLGKPVGSMSAVEYHARKPELRGIIAGCLDRLRARHDLVIIEGAGSPAEINLRDRDVVNMHVARVAGAPVLLVGDIDRGGVFAAFVGTLELLEPEDRARVVAFVVNKFRGDVALLAPGLAYLTRRTAVPVLGVVPYIRGLRLPDEDSVSLDDRMAAPAPAREGTIVVAVVRLPRISNHDDFAPLEHEPGVAVRWVDRAEDVVAADLAVLPGSKSTVADLAWLRRSGLAEAIWARARAGAPILGVCGGCQMLGQSVEDHEGVESAEPVAAGLGLLPLRTRFGRAKVTAQVHARAVTASFLAAAGDAVAGYEIHMGTVTPTRPAPPAFAVTRRNGEPVDVPDGAVGEDGVVVGTMLHGLFENDAVRARLIAELRARRGLPVAPAALAPPRESEYDRLAAIFAASIDRALLGRLVGLARVE